MKNNRIGIILIISSLAVITLVLGMLLQRQQATESEQIRIQGLGTIRSLAALPAQVLLPSAGQPSVLQSVLAYRDNPNFAYAAITNPAGRNLAEVTGAGILAPAPAAPGLSGFSERAIAAAADGQRTIREFSGPLGTTDGSRLQLRVGYFEPRTLLDIKDLPFYAAIALFVFLLVPLIYLVIKREMAPLAAIGEQLRVVVARESLPLRSAEPDRDVRGLASELNRYLDHASRRIRELEQSSVATVATGRLLEYNTSKMQSMLHCLPDGLLALDPAGDVTFATGKIEHLLGVPVGRVLSEPVEAWCQDAQLRSVLARLRSGRGDSRHPEHFEFTPVRVDQKRVSATVQPLQDAGGAIGFGTLVVLRDATAEHLARQAGNDFVAHVSHELKSPLNVLAMYTEMLADAAIAPDLRVEAVNVIHDEVDRMNSLVNNLLNVSKLEMGSVRPERHRVKLDELLRDAWQQALPRAQQKQVGLDISVQHDIAAVSVDKDLFRIALNNLINNAIKYNETGGNVILAAEETDADVVISVRDTGIGMAKEDQARVTEKFYRVRETGPNQRGGHGLGLYLANQIVELHHGRLSLDSELGRGSVFSIHLKKMPSLAEGTNIL